MTTGANHNKHANVTDIIALNAEADDALEAARALPHGNERNEALKKASVLRDMANKRGILFARKGRPRAS